MSTPFTFPAGSYASQDPREDYYNLYSNFASRMQVPQPESFLDPNDPELANLRNLYARPTGSMDLVNNYLSRMPTPEAYEPTTGTKWRGLLLGALSGGNAAAGYKVAKGFTDEPYADAYKQWTDEGKFVDDQERLIEADRAREIKATEFGVRQKAAAAQRASMETRAGNTNAANLARGAATEAERLRNDEDRHSAQEALDKSRAANLETQRLRLALEQERLDWNKLHATDVETTKANSEANKAKQMEAQQKIQEIAKAKIVNHPLYRQYFESKRNPLDPTSTIVKLKKDTPQAIRVQIQGLIGLAAKGGEIGGEF